MPALGPAAYLGVAESDPGAVSFDHLDIEPASSVTTTGLVAWNDHQIIGRSVRVLVDVALPASAVHGDVALTEGATVLATAPLSLEGPTVIEVADLPVGAHRLVAAYEGSADSLPSNSPPVTVTVLPKRKADVAIEASANPTPASGSATLNVTITVDPADVKAGASGKGVTGWLQFMDGNSPLGSPINIYQWPGANAFETRSYVSGSFGGLSAGTHAITAVVQESLLTARSTSSVLSLQVK